MKEEIAAAFRVQELQRREARRQVILNEAALLDEPIAKHALGVDAALKRLRESQAEETRARMNLLWAQKSFWQRIKAAFRAQPF